MFVEITLIQRMSLFLGHPIYSLAIVLFSIILATGVGSLLSDRAVPLSVGSLVGWPLVLAVYLGLLPLWWGKLLDETETGSLIERASVCLVMVVPAGVLMGFMFPTGMRLCTRIDSRITPWLWAVNGAAGVLASGAVVLVSIATSLNHSLRARGRCLRVVGRRRPAASQDSAVQQRWGLRRHLGPAPCARTLAHNFVEQMAEVGLPRKATFRRDLRERVA